MTTAYKIAAARVTPATRKEHLDSEKFQNPLTKAVVQILCCEAGYDIIRVCGNRRFNAVLLTRAFLLLSRMNSKRDFTLCFKQQFNIILLPQSGPHMWSLTSKLAN